MTAKFCLSEESGEDSPTRNESFESDDLQPPPIPSPGYVLAPNSYLPDEEKYEVNAIIHEVQPEAVVFVATMRKFNVQPLAPFVIISKGYAAEFFPKGRETVTLQTPNKSKKWHPRSYVKKDGMYMLKDEWAEFVEDNHVQEGDICLFIPTKGGRRFTFTVHVLHKSAAANSRAGTTSKNSLAAHIKEEPTEGEYVSSESSSHGVSLKSFVNKDSDGPPELSYVLPMRSKLSQSQKKIVEKKVRDIQSEIPIYAVIMNNSHENLLTFGTRYAGAYLPNTKQSVELHCMGKTWTANMVINNRDRRILSGGWSKFVSDNHLRAGDICLLELNKKMKKLTMTIHVIFQ